MHPEGCSKRPCFGLPPVGDEGGNATRCAAHREPGMVDLDRRKKCDLCDKQPTFGSIEAGHQATRCAAHKEPGMQNVVDRRCDLCDKVPSFGMPGQRAKRCATHKEPGMGNVVNRRRRCELCDKHAVCGLPGCPVSRCTEHTEDGMFPSSVMRAAGMLAGLAHACACASG